MSSLRNAVKRSTHKERAQPAARKHLGLLEKHSDYKKRADDYKKKTARLKTLTRKAAERNQDEFYFAMTKTVAGERRGPAGANSTHAATAKLKAEDLRYVHMRKVVDDRRVDKLRAGLHRTETAAETAEHTYFDDGGAARGARSARRRVRDAARPRRPDKAARAPASRPPRLRVARLGRRPARRDGPAPAPRGREARPPRQGPQAQGRGRGARPRRGLQVEEV